MLKILRKIRDAIIEAQERRAAERIARYLKDWDSDFRNKDYHDIVNRMMDKKNPTDINGNPVKVKTCTQ